MSLSESLRAKNNFLITGVKNKNKFSHLIYCGEKSMFKKATKKNIKLRLAIAAPSGSGKTYSALRIASGIGGKIAFIDTENRSAERYADLFDFDVLDLSKELSIDSMIKAIESASSAGYATCIIDSLSHAWEYLLEQIDQLARAKYQGNTFRAWSEGTPEQKRLINAILNSSCHMICCMRVKSEYLIDKDERTGRQRITRVGLAPRQREGMEYEFDMLMEGTVEHYFTVSKDRTGKFQDQVILKPSEDFGAQLAVWLSSGGYNVEAVFSHIIPSVTQEKKEEPVFNPRQCEVIRVAKDYGFTIAKLNEDAVKRGLKSFKDADEQLCSNWLNYFAKKG